MLFQTNNLINGSFLVRGLTDFSIIRETHMAHSFTIPMVQTSPMIKEWVAYFSQVVSFYGLIAIIDRSWSVNIHIITRRRTQLP